MFETRDIIVTFWVIVIGGVIGFVVGILHTFFESPETFVSLLI